MENGFIIWLFVALLVGMLLGGLAVFLGVRKPLRSKNYKALEADHQALKQSVSDHFVKTAELVNGLTDAYKSVFDHLQAGASQLVDAETLQEKLSYDDQTVVTLPRIGQSQPGNGAEATPVGASDDEGQGPEHPKPASDKDSESDAERESVAEPPRF